MHIRVLGAVEVVDAGGRARTPSPQLCRLIGLLVSSDTGIVSADRLAEYVADGRVDGSTVRTAVSRLRKLLGGRVESVGGGYRLVAGPGEVQVVVPSPSPATSSARSSEVKHQLPA